MLLKTSNMCVVKLIGRCTHGKVPRMVAPLAMTSAQPSSQVTFVPTASWLLQ